ncbi:MAG: hypothetical protein HXY34_13250, partial [Candidatus Thorarchaeota archaeon]|nr:hypothetical protein [Candidatus Thorarchaeota archaeon]
IKVKVMGLRSHIPDGAGGKRKLPFVLLAQVKDAVRLEDFSSEVDLTPEQSEYIRKELKTDAWTPVAIWSPKNVGPTDRESLLALLAQAKEYMRGVFFHEPSQAGWPPFAETEVLKP